MKKKTIILLVLFNILLISSCINLKIKTPEDPGWGIGFFIVSNTIDTNENFEKPVRNSSVYASDESIYAIIKILNIENNARISWSWYGPDKKIVKRSSVTEVNMNSRFLEYFVIWDSLDKSFYERKKGQWSVTVTAEGEFLAKLDFMIN